MSGLSQRVADVSWYHTIELAPGVVTPGHFDLRSTAGRVPLPPSLKGKRCLDVGTWDGFWAFEMERRGASEVVAVDLDDPAQWDWPPESRMGAGPAGLEYLRHVKSEDRAFDVAHDALGSRVERRVISIYDLSPEELGTFDVVFLGSLLLHLRDPVLALDRLRTVCHGEAVICDAVELIPSILRPRTPVARLVGMTEPWWWQPNVAGLRQMVRSAGWEIVQRTGVFLVRTGEAHPRPPLREIVGSLGNAGDRERAIVRLTGGLPHTAVRAVARS